MPIATPAFAAVRPRVTMTRTGEARLLEEVVEELAEEYASGLIRIIGGSGSGKSTALAHLAAIYAHDERLVFFDEPTAEELDRYDPEALVVATMPSGAGRGIELALQPWRMDELIEYLLAAHHDACASVMQRLGPASNWSWAPEMACVVLERFAADESLDDPSEALTQHVYGQLQTNKQSAAVARYCFAVLAGRGQELETAAAKLRKSGCPSELRKLLRHKLVQLPLAGDYLIAALRNGDFRELIHPLPWELVEFVGRRGQHDSGIAERLRKILADNRAASAHAMAASILLVVDPSWRPEKREGGWHLAGGVFRDAQWSIVDLVSASLNQCDFLAADLRGALLDSAFAREADFDGAVLDNTSMSRIHASNASFHQASLQRTRMPNATLTKADFNEADLCEAALMMSDLTGVDLTGAALRKADLSHARLQRAVLAGADFTDAMLRTADLSNADLRQVILDGACLETAVLRGAQMEDLHIANAQFSGAVLAGAHLTGSCLTCADLRGADLSGAGLAEINWENADLRGANLRGATFHMGSSRSGLVGSPIACEGSKTGFYTDDLEDMTFKRPEEVRKANLRGADLRGAAAPNVDFYLVDLRDAKLDEALRDHARQTGAILEDRTH